MTIHSDDTLQSCLNRLLHSGDFNEPLAQYLAEILQHFGAGPPAPTGVPEAPTDSQLYGRENAGWQVVPAGGTDPAAVRKTGDTMTGPLTLDISQGNKPGGNPILVFVDADGNWSPVHLTMQQYGLGLQFDGGLAFTGPTYLIEVNPGNATVNCHGSYPRWVLMAAYPAAHIEISDDGGANQIKLDANGDLIVAQTTGPNTGKSVNLTAGKWA